MSDDSPVILLAVDHSPWAVRVVDTGQVLASELGARLHLFHAHPSDKATEDYEWCYGLRGRLDGQNTELEVVAGDPVEEIVRKSESLTGLLFIVMGTHGRRGIRHAVLGSDAEAVVRASPSPVLLVRERGRG